jgi:hypothetical protein
LVSVPGSLESSIDPQQHDKISGKVSTTIFNFPDAKGRVVGVSAFVDHHLPDAHVAAEALVQTVIAENGIDILGFVGEEVIGVADQIENDLDEPDDQLQPPEGSRKHRAPIPRCLIRRDADERRHIVEAADHPIQRHDVGSLKRRPDNGEIAV